MTRKHKGRAIWEGIRTTPSFRGSSSSAKNGATRDKVLREHAMRRRHLDRTTWGTAYSIPALLSSDANA